MIWKDYDALVIDKLDADGFPFVELAVLSFGEVRNVVDCFNIGVGGVKAVV